MKRKSLQENLSKNKPRGSKNLSKWDAAIVEARDRIAELKRSIRTFQSLRDSGMQFPEPTKERSRKAKQSAAKP
jgi:hypothetical protein